MNVSMKLEFCEGRRKFKIRGGVGCRCIGVSTKATSSLDGKKDEKYLVAGCETKRRQVEIDRLGDVPSKFVKGSDARNRNRDRHLDSNFTDCRKKTSPTKKKPHTHTVEKVTAKLSNAEKRSSVVLGVRKNARPRI